jgi:hypothetical protein
MHVLLTEAKFGDADPLYEPLRDTGSRVSRCHWRGGVCRALAPALTCPLDDAADPPTLVVDVRDGGAEVTAREFGIVCALRAQVPVVLVPSVPGVPATAPAGLTSRVLVTDVESLLATCRVTVDRPLPSGGGIRQ